MHRRALPFPASHRLAVLAIASLVFLPPGLRGQERPDSAFLDENARRLVTRAVAAWEQMEERDELTAQIRARARLGLLIPNQWNWRARTLYHKQTVEALRFGPDNTVEQETLASERGAPIIGSQLLGAEPLWGVFGFDPEQEEPPLLGLVGLSLGSIGSRPIQTAGGDRFELLDSAFVEPLSVEGTGYYQFRSGPDLQSEETGGRVYPSVEFRTRGNPRHPVVGLIWFDPETDFPVRTLIRPTGRWSVQAGLRGWVRRVPLLPKNAEAQIEFIVVDYGPGEPLRARSATLQGNLFWFWNQGIMPVDVEWALDWSHDSAETMDREPPPILEAGALSAIELDELAPFIRELDRVSGRPPFQTFRQTVTGFVGSARFNQVQGINFKVRYPIPLSGRTEIRTQIDIPTSSFQWTGSAGLWSLRAPDRIGAEGYARLADANWMEVVNGIGGSLNALLTGYDDGNYYLAQGGRLVGETVERPWTGQVEIFVERQQEADKRVDYSLFPPDSAAEPFSIDVDEGTYFGARARMNFQLGDDSQRGVLLVRLFGQAAMGEQTYSSIGTTTDLLGPIPGPFVGAIRANYALSAGNVPSQALYYLGGTKTIRGYPNGVASGKSMYITTAELATNIPLIRLVAFVDAGNADDGGKLFAASPLWAAGGGLSIGDGIVRFDLAKGLSEGGVWRFHIASSAMF